MTSGVPVLSWAAVLCPNEAQFCPVFLPSNPHPKTLDEDDKSQLFKLLGEEIANAVSRDPKVHASIWRGQRVEILWSKTGFHEKIKECLRREGILQVELQGKEIALRAYRLSEEICNLYRDNLPLTQSILYYLAAQGKNVSSSHISQLYQTRLQTWNLDRVKAPGIDDRKCPSIPNTKALAIVDPRELSRGSKSKFEAEFGIYRYGISPEDSLTLQALNKEDYNDLLSIVRAFHSVGLSFTKESFKLLTQSKAHFEDIRDALRALWPCISLTKEICQQLLEEPGYAETLRAGIDFLHYKNIPIERDMGKLFLGSAEEAKEMFWLIKELHPVTHFQLMSNLEHLAANQKYAVDIKNALDTVRQAGIPLTGGFCALVVQLIHKLYPLEPKDIVALAAHTHAIRKARESLQSSGFLLTRDELLFLIAKGAEAEKIGNDAHKVRWVIQSAEDADIPLEERDSLRVMDQAEHGDKISSAIDFLHNHIDLPLTREDFLLLVAHGAQAEEL